MTPIFASISTGRGGSAVPAQTPRAPASATGRRWLGRVHPNSATVLAQAKTMHARRARFPLALVGALMVLRAAALCAADPGAVLASARAAAGVGDASYKGVIIETGSERSSGLNGRWSKTVDLGTGKMRAATDFGIYSIGMVWDGRHYWRQDGSGGVHPIDSDFMQAVHVTDAWLAQLGYLRGDALGARLAPLNDRTAEGRTFSIIQATPRHGQPVELWFDQGTKRLARTVQVLPIDVRTVRYEDYRSVGGLVLPFRITTDYGDDSNAEVVQIDRVARSSANTETFGRPQPPDDFAIAGGKTVVSVEFDGDVIVEAKLNGQGPLAFILDTGGHDILTPGAAAALGLNPVGAGTGGGSGEGKVSEQYARVDRLQIGGLTMRDQRFIIIPLQYNTVERGARPPLAGILGLELFERLAIRLDYHGQTLQFEPLADYRHRGGGTVVPIVFSDDEPLLMAKIAGVSGDVGLDTGNSGTLIVQGIWADAHGLKAQMMSGFPSLGFGMGGASSNWSSRVDFELAGQRFPRIIGRYALDKGGAFSSRTESGNVGNQILANFTLEFDYGHGQIWFEPVQGTEQLPFSRAGVSVLKERAEAFKVVAVAAQTPAAEAGLQVNDEIVAVDGKPSREVSGWDFRRATRLPPGTKLTLSIVRSGQPLKVILTLRELLP